ncbi:uncharacterized protein F5891DRAFT_983785 [Suillus fuscotomentosus]|uniref:Uncharacterized protein n=1 Tax=Suillus fuscotomentosus TaxID=1912939 RepID=A0AAD4DY48_9AGAM|nr:uncharacterized protein F5891DRAFT_983785 [Suillus fuscotomentosus]KAG1896092.1 hypothetical protein F5891DRAFT_983785 [Suillus fuscotomentosus]
MLFLFNSDNSALFFDSILFREEALFTFSTSNVLAFVGYVSVGAPVALYPLYSSQAGLTMLRSQILLSAYLRTGLLHNAAYEQGPDLEVPIYALDSSPNAFNIPYVGRRLGHDGNHYNLYSCVDYNDSVVHPALYPAGYDPLLYVELPLLYFPPMSNAMFDLTQTALIPLNSAPLLKSSLHAAPSSSESGLVGPGSILGSSILESSYMGSSAYPAYGGDTSTDVSSPITKQTSAKKPKKVMLQYINSKYPKWARALGNLWCMIRVAMCRRDTPSPFLLVMADYAAERKALIESIWPQALTCCNLQPMDLEPVLTIPTKNIMSEAEILALCHVKDSMMINGTGFDLKHIFGVALHDKVIALTLKLMRLWASCLPLADNGLVWFLENQITQEDAAHPPMATLSLVVTSCYEVLLDYIDSEAEDFHGFISPNKMFMQICEILPVLFNQSDDPDHAPFIIAMKALSDKNAMCRKADVRRDVTHLTWQYNIHPSCLLMKPICHELLQNRKGNMTMCQVDECLARQTAWPGYPRWRKEFDRQKCAIALPLLPTNSIALNLDVLGITHSESNILPDSLFTTASVLFGLVDPLDIKALIEVSLKEDTTQTGLQQEEESCLEYLKRGGRFLMEERMDQAQLEVSLFSNAIANLCEELNGRCHPTPSSVNPEKLVTPNAVRPSKKNAMHGSAHRRSLRIPHKILIPAKYFLISQ